MPRGVPHALCQATDAVLQTTQAKRRSTPSCNLRATERKGRITLRPSPPGNTCTASPDRVSESRRFFLALWLTFTQGCSGRLYARSPRSSPIFRLFARRASVADRRGLIRKYATPVWKFGRRLDAALGRSRSIKGRTSNRFNQHSSPSFVFSHPFLPPLPHYTHCSAYYAVRLLSSFACSN